MVKFVQQEHDYGCGVACLAMWLGKSYKQIQKKHFNENDFSLSGLSEPELLKCLKSYGIRAYPFDRLVLQVPGILAVPSLNQSYATHYVYWDKPGGLYDPNEGRGGRGVYDVKNPIRAFRHYVDIEHPYIQRLLVHKIKKITEYLLPEEELPG